MINIMKNNTYSIFIILCLLASSCARKISICGCPRPIDYSKEFQINLVKDLENIDSYYINQVVIDWFNINKELKENYDL